VESEETVCGITEDEVRAFQPSARPACPECGGKDVISSFPQWVCKTCGKKFNKFFRGPTIVKGRDHIRCPKCGEGNPQSCGNRWRCKNCYRTWYKDRK